MDNPLMKAAVGVSKIPSKVEIALRYTWHSVYGNDISVLDIYYALYKLYTTSDSVYADLAICMTTLLCNSFTEEKRDHLFTDSYLNTKNDHDPVYTEDDLLRAYQNISTLSAADVFHDMDGNSVFSYAGYQGNRVSYIELAVAVYGCGSDPYECVDWIYNVLYGLIGSIQDSIGNKEVTI